MKYKQYFLLIGNLFKKLFFMINVDICMSIFKIFLFYTIISSLIKWGNIPKRRPFDLLNISHINDTINEYLSHIPEKYNKSKEDEKIFLNKYLSLKELPSNKPKLISQIKEELLQKFSKEFNKNLTQINN